MVSNEKSRSDVRRFRGASAKRCFPFRPCFVLLLKVRIAAANERSARNED